jgi:hypothetical protein
MTPSIHYSVPGPDVANFKNASFKKTMDSERVRGLMRALDAWSRERAEARAEARFMVLAQRDPRMMAEFRRAQAQVQDEQHPN